ncbi:hypothetical protein BSKO_10165 [Bryopsis sp. KO-2023]|nr:hypothetical protein BSKO_10165 [Bryopsis sp. KO-2023]
MRAKILIDAGQEDDECDGLLTSLGDWFWESVFKKISFSERARAELVCRKWYEVLRLRFFWTSVELTSDEKMAGQVFSPLRPFVKFIVPRLPVSHQQGEAWDALLGVFGPHDQEFSCFGAGPCGV